MASARAAPARRVRRRVLPHEPADRIGRARRAGRRVDERSDRGLVEREEDGVVDRGRRRAVVDRVPLPVDRRVLDGSRVLRPRHAVVVGHRGAEIGERLEVGEVDVAVVVGRDVGVAAARRQVRPQAAVGDEVELLPVVGRAVDERVLVVRPTGPTPRTCRRNRSGRAARPRCAAGRRRSRRRTSRSTSVARRRDHRHRVRRRPGGANGFCASTRRRP